MQSNARLWIYSPLTTVCGDPAAMGGGDRSVAQGSNRIFYAHHCFAGRPQRPLRHHRRRRETTSTWAGQLGAMAGDIAAALG